MFYLGFICGRATGISSKGKERRVTKEGPQGDPGETQRETNGDWGQLDLGGQTCGGSKVKPGYQGG